MKLKKICIYLGYIAFILASVEISSYLTYEIYNWYFTVSAPKQKSDPLISELRIVEGGGILFPTRWYTSKPNFTGQFITTDESGFRINRERLSKQKSIGFFGGSTMFSVLTDQATTIPNLVTIKDYDSLNFGAGGYSTSAELPTFIEATRKYPSIKYAVFYDGVNEVARMIEQIQDVPDLKIFDKVGYYYKPNIESSLDSLNPHSHYFRGFYTYRIILKLQTLLNGRVNNKKNKLDLDQVASEITNLYFLNISDINALAESKSIQTLFIWQPTLYTTRKKLSPREEDVKSRDLSLAPLLVPLVRNKVMTDPRASKYKIVDMSNGFDRVQEEIFSDWCHVNAIGNKAIAQRMQALIGSTLR